MIDGSANAMNKCWFSWSCIYIQSSVWDSVSDEDDSRVDHMRFVQLERHICRVLQKIWRHVSLVLKMNQSHQTFSVFCDNICARLWFGWEVCPDTFKSVNEGQIMGWYYRQLSACVGEHGITLTHCWNSTHLSVQLDFVKVPTEWIRSIMMRECINNYE